MVRVAAGDRVVLQVAEAARECHVLRAGDVLVPQKDHPVLEQRSLELGEQVIVPAGVSQMDAADLGADGGGQWTDVHEFLLGMQRGRVR